MKRSLQILLCSLVITSSGFAQTRYLDNVFTSATVTSDVVYANNLWCTILGDCNLGVLSAKDIKMDVYEPMGDTVGNVYYEAERALILVMHTGNFLTRGLNGAPTGYKDDSVVVEMCTRFAKKGYVAVAMSYRLGWNPTSTIEQIRTGTIINAAYRGVQDAHTCIRYFKKDATIGGNTFGIDTTRIVVGGIGTGSYVSLGFATFNKFEELYLNKFIDFSDIANPVPFIDTAMSGDFKGLLARPLNTPNHLGYSSDISMVFNLGGAMGDSTWMVKGDVPIVSFHTTKDPAAPYGYGAVIVPTTGDFVLNASGSSDVIRRANYLCNNNVFNMGPALTDVYTTRANMLNSSGSITNEAGVVNPNSGDEGLFPFVTTPPGANTCTDPDPPNNVFVETEQGNPWDWWDEVWYAALAPALGNDGPYEVCSARLGNPDMSPAKGKAYVDTIQGYLAPRLYRVLFENVVDSGCTVPVWAGTDKIESSISLSIYPNPANAAVNIQSDDSALIMSVELYDVTGRLMVREDNLATNKYQLERNSIAPGLYFVNVRFKDQEITRTIIFE